MDSAFLKKADWLIRSAATGDIRPYVFVRNENRITQAGTRHHCDWFPWKAIYKDPTHLSELPFAEMIFHLENSAFGHSNMPMPRWVFYDCAVMPGFVAGFAMKSSSLPQSIRDVMPNPDQSEWVPLSLFIIIPTMKKGEWVAHNLCAVNSLLPEAERLYGLGFLSKAFGLWYANVETCCGMTQWGSPALKLHSHYGHMQILTAYTPVHTYANTITYRSQVDSELWESFFSREKDFGFIERHEPSGLIIDPQNQQSMIDLQQRIQKGEGPFYISAAEMAAKKLMDPQTVYRTKGNL